MHSYIFDTSFLISLIDGDDINHEIACKSIENLDANEHKFFINDLIISETYTVLSYKIDFDHILLLEKFLESLPVQYIGNNTEEYLSFFKLFGGKISVADASVVSDAFKHGFDILAFDKKLLSLHAEMRFWK